MTPRCLSLTADRLPEKKKTTMKTHLMEACLYKLHTSDLFVAIGALCVREKKIIKSYNNLIFILFHPSFDIYQEIGSFKITLLLQRDLSHTHSGTLT